MMTPRLPLLALAAALSTSAAAAELPRRCSADWLKKTAAVVSQGGAPANADKALVEEAIEGGTRLVVDLNAASFPCDAPLKRYLAVQAPVGEPVLDAKTGKPVGGVMWAWADDGTRDAWRKGLDQQLRILAATDELYSTVDAKGRAVLEKADAVVDAAVKLGVAAKKDGAALDKLKTAGYTGAAYEKEKAYTIEAPASAPATAPADMKAALSALLKDPPTPKAAKGKPAPKPGAPVLGPAPLAFRKAVIALASELAIRSARRDLLQKQGVDAGVKTDFAQGSKVNGFAAFAEGPNGIPDNVASKDANYNAALSYLTDPKIVAGDDPATHDSAALSRLDFGLRNLIASRAAAVDAAVAAARKRLNGATVKSALATVDRDANAGDPLRSSSKLAPAADMSAGVLAKLQGSKDFADLNALFEARSKAAAADPNSPAAKWMASPQGQEAKAKLDTMRADAKATAVAGDQLQYSVGGAKFSSPVRVPGLKNDAYRGAIQDAVVTAIMKGSPFSAELQAALAAFRNDPAAAPLSPEQAATAGKLPPVEAKPAEPASAWDKIAQATPAPGWFSSYQGRIQKYQDEEHEKAAAEAAAASTKRREVQRAADAARAAESRKCDDEKKEISGREADPLWKPEVAAKWRSDMLAAKGKECEGRVQGAFDKVVADAHLTDPVAVDEARKKRIADADALVAKAYADGIMASVGELHKEYRDDKSDRARKAAAESKFYTFYGKHLDLVDGYFKKTWEDKKDESTGACRGLLWHPAKGEDVAAEFRDPTRDNVDDRCVHKGLVSHLKGYIGTGDKAD